MLGTARGANINSQGAFCLGLSTGTCIVGRPAKTYIISVWTQDTAKNTRQERWKIGTDAERKTGNSVLWGWFHDHHDHDG